LFESLPVDDAAARLRAAAAAPLAAVGLTLLYLTIYPTLPVVPAPLFWLVAALLLLGAILGARGLLVVVRAQRIRGRAVVWLIGALAVELVCVRLFVGFVLPWI
jgi:hypothetical protein